MPGILEVGDAAAGGGDHRGGGEQTNAVNGEQLRTGRALPGQGGQLTLQLGDAQFKQADSRKRPYTVGRSVP